MNKKSESLNKLEELKYNIQDEMAYHYKGYACCKEEMHKYDEDFAVIEQDLLELQSIKESNPSKALEYLEHIKKDDFNMIITTYPPLPAYNGITKDEMFDEIEQALLNAQIEHKALEVIKEKPCTSGLCINYLKANNSYSKMQDYEHYCMTIRGYDRIDEDEFNILKEWVLNE